MNVDIVNNQVERGMKELKRKLIREGLFKDISKKRYYYKPSIKKKMKREDAAKKKIQDRKRFFNRDI